MLLVAVSVYGPRPHVSAEGRKCTRTHKQKHRELLETPVDATFSPAEVKPQLELRRDWASGGLQVELGSW